MPNITLAVPEDLHEKMKKHSEIRWSEVARKAISQKMEDLETMDRITAKSRLMQKDADEIAKKVNSNVARKLGLK